MKRKTYVTLASAVLSLGLLAGCESDNARQGTNYGFGNTNGAPEGTPPVNYGIEGNRTATVPPADAAVGTGDHRPADNYQRMGPAAFHGAGSAEKPSPGERVGVTNQPAPNTANQGGPVGSSPANTDGAAPAGSTLPPANPVAPSNNGNQNVGPRSDAGASDAVVFPIFAADSGAAS